MEKESKKGIVTVTIDGQVAQVERETTILQAARGLGISIPTLCYHPALEPYGACRVCTVEIQMGKRTRMVTACNYPIREEGITVFTRSERTLRTRKLIVELLWARCPEVEVIKNLAHELGISQPRFPQEDKSEKCILCGLCVNVCSQIVGRNAIGFIGRGTSRQIAPPFLKQAEECIGCGSCAYVCPTGAIQLEDANKIRKIEKWHTQLEKSECILCGRPIASSKQIEEILAKLSVSKEYVKICPECRRRNQAKYLILTQPIKEKTL